MTGTSAPTNNLDVPRIPEPTMNRRGAARRHPTNNRRRHLWSTYNVLVTTRMSRALLVRLRIQVIVCPTKLPLDDELSVLRVTSEMPGPCTSAVKTKRTNLWTVTLPVGAGPQ